MAHAPAEGYALFETPIGTCALAWGPAGIRRSLLPHATPEETRARLLAGLGDLPEARPPRPVATAIRLLQRLLDGKAADLTTVRLDLSDVTPFRRAVYEALRKVPPGETVTYAELAGLAGSPGAHRAVGGAMANNPLSLLVPCHRVVAAGGRPGGFSALGGLETKARLLELEGAARLCPRQRRLPYDPEEAVTALSRADRRLAKLMAKVGPLELEVEPRRTPFQSLTRSIAYQQLHGKAAATILARVRDLFPPPFPTPEGVLETPEEDLRATGLSRSKVAALRDLAARTLDGTVPSLGRIRRMTDEEIVTRLVQVRGIGPWSVEMFLIFGLGRPDVLPVTDYGVRKGFAATFGLAELPNAATMLRRGERWRPWRSVASWYLWRAADMA